MVNGIKYLKSTRAIVASVMANLRKEQQQATNIQAQEEMEKSLHELEQMLGFIDQRCEEKQGPG
ncbi:MAG: hypothetical protein ACOX2J_03275 [Bacillota bacterium]